MNETTVQAKCQPKTGVNETTAQAKCDTGLVQFLAIVKSLKRFLDTSVAGWYIKQSQKSTSPLT